MTNTDRIEQVPTVAQSIEGLRDLIDIWDDGEEFVTVPLIEESPLTGVAIRVLAEHAVALTKSIVLLAEHGMFIQAAPLIRLTMECGITAAWFSVAPNAGNAANHEGARQRRLILESMFQDAGIGDEQMVIEATESVRDLAKYESAPAGKFEQRCNQIVGGKDLYVHYRILSQVSHAGLALLDPYLHEVDITSENPIGYAFLKEANYTSAQVSLGYQISMLCLTLTAWDNISKDRPNSSQLQSVANRFGCNRNIELIKPPTVL
ncbi:MAG: hypothetical protein HY050_10115 [Actinobacteria bacterium]|nr:hypothetical protein [Actinomycetota bacterium]